MASILTDADNQSSERSNDKPVRKRSFRLRCVSSLKKVPVNPEDEVNASKSIDETPLIPPDTTSKRSFSSTNSKMSDYPDICRICHCEGTIDEPLISPCYCLGTMQYLHQSCLQRWIKSAGVKSCELCKFEFIMHSEIKPFKQVSRRCFSFVGEEATETYYSLVAEARYERGRTTENHVFGGFQPHCRDLCSLVIVCVNREDQRGCENGQTSYVEEVRGTERGSIVLYFIEWPFWTKLIVVAIGFTGGLVRERRQLKKRDSLYLFRSFFMSNVRCTFR
jgi:hypothetical protein